MSGPTLLLLAAGLGTRFDPSGSGVPKQLQPVGPDGEAIVDLNAGLAARAGFARAVIVTRRALLPALDRDMDRHWPSGLPVHIVCQDDDSPDGRPQGTAHAVVAAAEHLEGTFAVANGDDVYGAAAWSDAAVFLRAGDRRGAAVVAFEVGRTLMGHRTVNRALLAIGTDGRLLAIAEGRVQSSLGHLIWTAGDQEVPLDPTSPVSMNLWLLEPGSLRLLEAGVHAAPPTGEVLLPSVLADGLSNGSPVRALRTGAAAYGLTHPEDLAELRSRLPALLAW